MTSKDRVSTANDNYLSTINQELSSKGITPTDAELLLRAYKTEEILETWVKSKKETNWKLLKIFPFCINSGLPGPKRKEGDLQIPEGLYHVNRFNPKSKFYLSLGINYPNNSDLKLSDSKHPGSDIFLHGGCQSVGCIAIQNEGIEYLYVLAGKAKANGQQQIPVRIFPCKMNSPNLDRLTFSYKEHLSFWKNLKIEDQYFEENKKLLSFSVNKDGAYLFQ
ncbi:MAG: murein L,D-transpeptidase family protein [Saprospiraceae bacterium]